MGCVGPELHLWHDGQPKGVVYSHRGAWTNAVNNVVTWEMPHHPVYSVDTAALSLQRLVLPWTITLLAGTHVFLRAPRRRAFIALRDTWCDASLWRAHHYVDDRQCGVRRAELVLQPVRMMTAAAPPPPRPFWRWSKWASRLPMYTG